MVFLFYFNFFILTQKHFLDLKEDYTSFCSMSIREMWENGGTLNATVFLKSFVTVTISYSGQVSSNLVEEKADHWAIKIQWKLGNFLDEEAMEKGKVVD